MTPKRVRGAWAATLVACLAIAIPTAASAAAAPGRPAAGVRDIAMPRGCAPLSVVVDPHRRAAWSNCVARISEAHQRVVHAFRFGGMAVAVDSKLGVAWVADNGNGTLTEISERTNHVIHRIDGIPQAVTVAVDPRARTVWVTSDPYVKEYSEVTRKLLHTIKLGLNNSQTPWNLTVDPRAGFAWVAIVPAGPHCTRTWVAQISEAKHKVIHTYPTPFCSTAVTAADPARGTVWMETGGGGTTGILKVIKEAAHRVVRTFSHLPLAGNGIAIDSRMARVLATGTDRVYVINEASGKILKSLTMRPFPQQIAVDQGTGNVYVALNATPAVAQFRI
ncbi:MAG TPA: hypothetical protein VF162_06260 [Streptosporangiaceae bacterium]